MAEQRNVFQEDTNDQYANLNELARLTGMEVATIADLHLSGYEAKIENDRVTFAPRSNDESSTDASSNP